MSQIRAKLHADIYRVTVDLLVTEDKRAAERFFRKDGFVASDGHLAEVGPSCLGKTVYDEGGPDMRIWLKRRRYLGVLAHELCHATIGILWCRGIKATPGDDEAFAYLYQSLFSQAMKALGYGKWSW